MPAEHQDVWYRPMSRHPADRAALGEDGRDSSDQPEGAQDHPPLDRVSRAEQRSRRRQHRAPRTVPIVRAVADDLVNRRPQLMEWAIGKGYDLFRPGTGKLLVPGEKISWDQHIHAVGEEITGGSEIGIWFYKKGEEPKKRSYLIGFTGIDRTKMLDIPPNSMAMTEGFTVLKENTLHRELPAALPSARQGDAGRGDSARRQQADHQLRRQLQLQLDDQLHLRRRRGAAAAQGHRHPRHRVVRQHQGATRTTPIRISGSATAIAPSTRWRTPG